jgi:hypothetical protein
VASVDGRLDQLASPGPRVVENASGTCSSLTAFEAGRSTAAATLFETAVVYAVDPCRRARS